MNVWVLSTLKICGKNNEYNDCSNEIIAIYSEENFIKAKYHYRKLCIEILNNKILDDRVNVEEENDDNTYDFFLSYHAHNICEVWNIILEKREVK